MRQNEAVETVKEIRGMMERSSRFMSFSGTSAIFIGLYALVGSFFTHRLLLSIKDVSVGYPMPDWAAVFPDVVHVAMIVLVLSLLTILLFSVRKAKKMNQSFINRPALRTFLNFFLPFTAGGGFLLLHYLMLGAWE